MNIPLVKEWGSWVVYLSSLVAAVVAVSADNAWSGDGGGVLVSISTVAGLTLLINAKNPLASVVRTRTKNRDQVLWLLFFGLSGLVLLIPFLIRGLDLFYLFSLLVVSYLVMLSLGKEHHLLAELNGFALITVPAPLFYFVLSGESSLKLYLAVYLFFAAGVFKVKVRLKKTLIYRSIMALYCFVAASIYFAFDISVAILLPLVENLVSVIMMREEKLRTTGYVELTKGLLFLLLLGFFW